MTAPNAKPRAGEHMAKRGEIYVHRHFMDEHRAPLLCKVTRIAQGVAYYRPYYGAHDDGSEWLGSPYYVALEKFWDSFNTQEQA